MAEDAAAAGQAADGHWRVECSDDEVYTDWQTVDGELMPPTEAIVKLYGELSAGRLPELSWRCPGRRAPLADAADDDDADQQIQLPDMSDFDFGSDDFAQPVVTTPRRAPGAAPKGSAKKKSTSFNKILMSVQKRKQMEAKEASEASAGKAAGGATPTKGGSAQTETADKKPA